MYIASTRRSNDGPILTLAPTGHGGQVTGGTLVVGGSTGGAAVVGGVVVLFW